MKSLEALLICPAENKEIKRWHKHEKVENKKLFQFLDVKLILPLRI